jgi:hypothetical protein
MVMAEEMVAGAGWISDDSSFYGEFQFYPATSMTSFITK